MTIEEQLPAFIRQHFRSVWALELLLLMKRNHARSWSADGLATEMRAPVSLMRNLVEGFARTGLVSVEPGALYRYSPPPGVMVSLCEALEAAYRERPVAIINLISAPEDRLQQLADAFRFKGGRR